MNTKNEKKGFLEIAGVQTVIASLICIILGLLVGYVVLLCINPSEAWSAMTAILKNFILPQAGGCSGIFRKHPCQNSASSYVYSVHLICL